MTSNKRIIDYFELFMVIIGSVGIMGVLFTSLYFPIEAIWSFILMVVYAIILYVLEKSRNFVGARYLTLGIYVCTVCSMFAIPSFKDALVFLIDVIRKDYFLKFNELIANNTTLCGIVSGIFFIFITTAIVHVLTYYVIYHKHIYIKNIIFLLIFVFPICIRHPIQSPISYLFVIFMILEYIFGYLMTYQKYSQSTKRYIMIILAVLVIFSHIFFAHQPAFQKSTTTALSYMTSYFNRDVLKRMIHGKNVTGTSVSIEGKLPDNDITLGQSLALDVYSTTPFDGFIRGYSLGTYENNEWSLSTEDFGYTRPIKTPTSSLIDLGYGFMSASVNIESQLYVDYKFTTYDLLYPETMVNDSYYEANDQPIEVGFISDDYSSIFDGSWSVEDNNASYLEHVEPAYMDVPFSIKEELYDYIDEQIKKINLEWTDVEQLDNYNKAKIIKEILAANNTYSLKTGQLPKDQDFVLYFLNESKKGSCTHFASSATLMLRVLGVPARYVTGYLVHKDDFDEEGHAKIYSYRSHAWVEIYQEGIGWIPFEMTPVNQNNDSVASMLDSFVKKEDTTSNTPQNPSTSQTSNNIITNQIQNDTKSFQIYDIVIKYKAYFITIASIILTISLCRLCLKFKLLYSLNKANTNEKILIYYSRLKKIEIQSQPIYKNINDLMYKARFSQYEISEKEYRLMKKYYHQYYCVVYRTQKWYHKIVMKLFILSH